MDIINFDVVICVFKFTISLQLLDLEYFNNVLTIRIMNYFFICYYVMKQKILLNQNHYLTLNFLLHFLNFLIYFLSLMISYLHYFIFLKVKEKIYFVNFLLVFDKYFLFLILFIIELFIIFLPNHLPKSFYSLY